MFKPFSLINFKRECSILANPRCLRLLGFFHEVRFDKDIHEKAIFAAGQSSPVIATCWRMQVVNIVTLGKGASGGGFFPNGLNSGMSSPSQPSAAPVAG